MRRPLWIVLGVVFALALNFPALGQDGKKKAVPSAAAQAKIEQLIRELYKDDLAKATDESAAKLRLAQTLLQEGRDTVDDAAGRYVLLKQAHKLAAEAGDINIALAAADELAQDFAIPSAELFQMRVQTLSTAAKANKAPREAYQTVVDSALLQLEETLAADDFPSSLALIAAADKAAIQLRNVALVASIRRRLDEVKSLQKEYAHYEKFAEQLAKSPNDPTANFEMGYYYALIRGNWEKGLKMLALGNGLAAKAAALESGPRQAMSLLKAPDAWVKFAKGTKDAPRIHALLHAYELCLKALPCVGEAERDALEARLAEINALLPSEYRAGEITTELKKIDLQGPVYSAAFSPDGRKIVAAAYDGSLRILDSRTGKELRRLDGHLGKVWTVAFPDSRRVVSGGFDGTVRIWDVVTAREMKQSRNHTDYIRSVAVSNDGQQIVSGGDDRLLRVWDQTGGASPGSALRSLTGHNHTVWSVALSRDGQQALSGSLDRTVRLWDVDKGKEVKKFEGHKDTVLAVAFSPLGRQAISGSTDKTLIVWDLETGKPAKTLTGHTGYVQSVAMSPDGRRAISGGADGKVCLWDVAAGTLLRTLDGHREPVWCVAFSRDGRFALSTGQDGSIRVWGGSR